MLLTLCFLAAPDAFSNIDRGFKLGSDEESLQHLNPLAPFRNFSTRALVYDVIEFGTTVKGHGFYVDQRWIAFGFVFGMPQITLCVAVLVLNVEDNALKIAKLTVKNDAKTHLQRKGKWQCL